jgi:hypothetical protein
MDVGMRLRTLAMDFSSLKAKMIIASFIMTVGSVPSR